MGKKYSGEEGERFGPTLAAEHLASDSVEVNAQTLRRWMLSEGLWSRARKRRMHRKRRERKEHVGELVQMDGSFHDWLEERGPGGCLMNMVDDASGDTLARLGSEETIWAAAGVLRAWVKKYGIPVALYTDWKNVYVREASTKEQLQGVVPVTQFGQMCQRLGIRIIAANTPQAKGRVERNHGTHQDRLVKKMRLQKIKTHAEANTFLENEYLPAQSAVSANPGPARGLSSSGPAGSGVGGSFSSGKRASDRQRLGGAARQPIFPGASASPALCAGQGQSHGVRMGGWAITDSLSRQGGGMEGDSGPTSSGRKTNGGHGQETKAAHAPSGSPLAAGLSQDAPLEQARKTARRVALCNVRLRSHMECPLGGRWRKGSHGGQAAEKKSARRAVEKTRRGKVKKRLSHSAWKSRQPRGIPTFPQPRRLREIN